MEWHCFLAVMTESSAVRWDQPRNQSPFKRRGGCRIEIYPPNKKQDIDKKCDIKIIRESISAHNSGAKTITLVREGQDPSTTSPTTCVANHSIDERAQLLRRSNRARGREHNRSTRKPKEESIQQQHHHQIVQNTVNLPQSRMNTSRATEPKVVRGKRGTGRSSRATKPKVVRGKSGRELRGRKVMASAEDAGRQRVPRSGSNDQIKQQQNGRH